MPFGQWAKRWGGREYCGLRTNRYTYARDLRGPWLLFDNQNDPHQLNNLIDDPQYIALAASLEKQLKKKLQDHGDQFLPARVYLQRWGYKVDATGTVPYSR